MKKIIIASAIVIVSLGGVGVYALASSNTKKAPAQTQSAPIVEAPKTEAVETPAPQPEVAPVIARPVEKKVEALVAPPVKEYVYTAQEASMVEWHKTHPNAYLCSRGYICTLEPDNSYLLQFPQEMRDLGILYKLTD
jgi:hypothetical protein